MIRYMRIRSFGIYTIQSWSSLFTHFNLSEYLDAIRPPLPTPSVALSTFPNPFLLLESKMAAIAFARPNTSLPYQWMFVSMLFAVNKKPDESSLPLY